MTPITLFDSLWACFEQGPCTYRQALETMRRLAGPPVSNKVDSADLALLSLLMVPALTRLARGRAL